MWDLWWTKCALAGLLPVLRFLLLILVPPIAPQSPSSIIWGWYKRTVVPAVPSGLSLTPLRIIKIIKYKKVIAFRHVYVKVISVR
jgi:hypothetical protein